MSEIASKELLEDKEQTLEGERQILESKEQTKPLDENTNNINGDLRARMLGTAVIVLPV